MVFYLNDLKPTELLHGLTQKLSEILNQVDLEYTDLLTGPISRNVVKTFLWLFFTKPKREFLFNGEAFEPNKELY